MDEYSTPGMEPEVKNYFRKIVRSFSYGFLWIFVSVIAGIYFKLAMPHDGVMWYNFLFYFLFLAGLILLIRFLYRTWKNG